MRYYSPHIRYDAAQDLPGDEQLDPKLVDADGKQLVQNHHATQTERADANDFPKQPQLDLDLASTERRRALRARTLRRR
jgi:hypothetical protein